MSEILPIHTSCKSCIFAIYNEKTQIDCAAGQLDKFRKHKVEILEAYDEDKEFNIINGRMCRLGRSSKWKEKLSVGPEGLSISGMLSVAIKESQVRYQVIVILDDKLANLKKTVTSINKQTLKPVLVSFIRPFNCKIKPTDIMTFLKENSNFKFKIENLLPDISNDKGIDLAVKGANTTFYIQCNSGYKLNPKTFSLLNKKINDELYEVALIKPDENGNGLIALKHFHTIMGGNRDLSLLEKVNEEKIECITINQFLKK